MGVSQSLRHEPILVERFVTLPATSGTAVGPTVGAGTLVLAAGLEVLQTVPDITTYTVNITDSTTTFGSALNIDNVPAGTIRAGTTAGLVATQDTIDAVSTISGTPGTIRARIWALVCDVQDTSRPAEAADRDVLA